MFGLTGIMGAGLAIAIAFGGYQYQRAERYEVERDVAIGNTEVLKGEIATQNQRIESYVAQVATNMIQIGYHEDRANKAEEARDREIRDINAWREKLRDEIQDRPKVVARAAGLGTRRVLLSIEGATTPSSGDDDRDSSATVSSSQTSPDN